MRLVYNVYDDDNQIESKQFDNFPKALEYAKKGLITYICEEDLDCPDCEEVVVWTWDSTWDDEEAINSVTQKECAPDEVECEEPFLDDNIEINISGPAKEVKNLVELVFDNAFDLDWDAPVENVKVDAPKCVDEFGLDEEPAIKDLDFDVDSPFEDDLYYSKEEDEDEKDLEIGEPEIIETSEEKFDDSELAMSDEDVAKVNEPFEENEPNGEESAKDEPEAKDEDPKSKDKDDKEDDQEELDELLDLNVSASIDGGDNNDVRVLSSCKQRRGNKKLDELLDANIDLGFSGGTGNNVSVLSPLGEETKDSEKVELTEGTGFFSLFDDAAEQLFLEKWSDILNDHLKNRINLLRLRVKRPSGRNYGSSSNDYITDFRVLKTEVWTYGTEPKLIFKLSAVKLDEKNLRITKPYIEIDLNILLDDLAAVDKVTGAVKPKSRIAASKNYDLACHWDYTSIEFTKWTSKPFKDLLNQLVEEQKELKQQTDGRNIKVKAAKKLAQFSQEEVSTAKNWFRNHINKIEFNIVSGSPRGISNDDFDIEREQIHTINKIHIENIDDAIEEAILGRQKKFLDDYNIKHITPSLDHEGTNIKIGTNIYLNWRRADEEVQSHLPYYITEFFNTCTIYFDTKIGNAPEPVINILTEAVYGSNRTERALDKNKYSLQNNLAGEMIINQLFNSDLNFLSDRLAASFDRKSKTVIKNLKEGLNNSEFEEYMQLCKEIGIKGNKDLESFLKEVGLDLGCPAQDVLQALRDYRAELGPDFKIVNESDKKELNELFGFGKKSKPKNRYLMAMFVDTSRRLYTSDVWQDILKIVEKYVDTKRSGRSYFAADIINQVEFVTTEDVFKRIESEVKIFLNGLHWKRKKYFTGSSDWVSGDGEVNFDIADAAKHLIGFARVQSNVKESISEEVSKLATQYILGYHNGNNYVFWLDDSRSFNAENFTYDLNNYNIKEFDSYEQAKMLGYIADEQWRKETGYEYYSIAVKAHNKNEYVITGSYESNTRYYDYDNNEWVDEITETCIFDSYTEANETKKYVNRFVSTEPLFMPLYIDQNGNIHENCLVSTVSEEVKLATNKKGDYLVVADSGKGYTVFSRNDVRIGGFDGEDDQKAIDKFNKGDFKESLKESLDLPEMRASEIERELDLHGDIYFNLLETVEESDEDGWRSASEVRIVDTGSNYEIYFEWLDQDGDYVCVDKDPEFTYETFEELLREIDGVYVTIVDLNESLNESQSQEISSEYDKLSKKYGIDFNDLVYGEEGFMKTKYPEGFPDFDGDVIYSEKYFRELKNFMSGWKNANELIAKSEARGEKLKKIPVDWLKDKKIRDEVESPSVQAKGRFICPEHDIYVFPENIFNWLRDYHNDTYTDEQLTEGRQPVYSNVIFYGYDQNNEEQTYTKTNMTPIMIRTEVDELVRNGAARVYVEAKIDGEWEALDKYTYDPEWTPGTPEYAARNSKDFALALESVEQEDDLTDQEFAEQFKQRLEEIKK